MRSLANFDKKVEEMKPSKRYVSYFPPFAVYNRIGNSKQANDDCKASWESL